MFDHLMKILLDLQERNPVFPLGAMVQYISNSVFAMTLENITTEDIVSQFGFPKKRIHILVVNLGGSSRKYQLGEWETEKTSNKGCVIKQVTTIHNLNLSLLGHSGR